MSDDRSHPDSALASVILQSQPTQQKQEQGFVHSPFQCLNLSVVCRLFENKGKGTVKMAAVHTTPASTEICQK